MKIGILGTGDVGQSLGKAFVATGHEVMMGGRETKNEKAEAWAQEMGSLASVGTFADAAKFCEIAVLATLGTAAEEAVKLAGTGNFHGKLVMDATNPLAFAPGKPPSLAISGDDSGGERVQRALPGAHVVKVFNTVGHNLMFRPELPGGPPDMFIAGNDEGAKERTRGILKDFGWETIDLGGIESSRYLEAMCVAWVLACARSNQWNAAFKLLRG
jgi:predicted dinucleotide-binding enzyme